MSFSKKIKGIVSQVVPSPIVIDFKKGVTRAVKKLAKQIEN